MAKQGEVEMDELEPRGKAKQNERSGKSSDRMERRYQVRQVTNIQASWMERERGDEGLFALQLILDNGVEEYILELDSDDVEPLLRLFRASPYTTFDLDRKVLMFSNLNAK